MVERGRERGRKRTKRERLSKKRRSDEKNRIVHVANADVASLFLFLFLRRFFLSFSLSLSLSLSLIRHYLRLYGLVGLEDVLEHAGVGLWRWSGLVEREESAFASSRKKSNPRKWFHSLARPSPPRAVDRPHHGDRVGLAQADDDEEEERKRGERRKEGKKGKEKRVEFLEFEFFFRGRPSLALFSLDPRPLDPPVALLLLLLLLRPSTPRTHPSFCKAPICFVIDIQKCFSFS